MNDGAEIVGNGAGSEGGTDGELSLGVAAGAVVGFGVILAGVAGITFGAFAAESVGAGAALVALDVYVLGRVVRALFDGSDANGGGGSNKALWGFIGIAKLFGLFGGSWWLLASGLVHPLGLAAGIVALPLGLAVAAVSMSASAANRGTRSPH
jgi:hypothetical protein